MEFLNEICCICWVKKNNLSKLNETFDTEMSFHQKLVTSIQEMNFEEMNDEYMICQECISDLDIVYNFRIKCLIAKTAITDYMIKLRENNIFNDEKDEKQNFNQVTKKLRTKIDKNCNFNGPNNLKEIFFKNLNMNQRENKSVETCDAEKESKTCKISLSDLDNKIISCKNGLEIYPIHVGYKNIPESSYLNNVLTDESMNTNNKEEKEDSEVNFDFVDVNVTEMEDNSNSNVQHFLYTDNADSNDQLKCNDCDLTFTQYTEYIIHMHQHSSKKPYECHMCSKKFTKELHYQNHLKTHPEDTKCKCTECGLEFIHEKFLKLHMKKHKLEMQTYSSPTYICDICGKVLTRPSHLRDHRMSHFRDSSYPCEICGKVFHYKRGLNKHMPIHSGVKPFKCELCNKTFNRKDNLTCHQRVHCKKKF